MAMTVDEMIAVLQAYKDGKTIQYKDRVSVHDDWFFAGCPSWDFSRRDYRVKPEPTVLEVTNKLWKNIFGIDDAISDTCCLIPANKSCEGCKIFDICRCDPRNVWNASYKGTELAMMGIAKSQEEVTE